MSKIIKNSTASNVLVADTGVNILPSATYIIPSQDYLIWSASSNVQTLISAGTLVINDGVNDLSITDGSNFIRFPDYAKNQRFDNSTNGFIAKNTQAAIEEARSSLSIPSTDQAYYVSKQGSDTTGNGSIGAPYLTIGKALTTISDASPTKRYLIDVGPGDYNENLSLKANVFVQGSGPIVTRLTGTTLNINDASWNAPSMDNRSGFQDISVNPTCTWDFTAQSSTEGKLYFFNIRTSGVWTTTAYNAINQLIVHDSQFFNTTTFNGMNTYITGGVWQSGSINVNSSAAVGIVAQLTIVGGRTNGAINATWTSNSAVTLNLSGLAVGASTVLTATGASCTVNANMDSIPVPANRSLVSSAILNFLNDRYSRGVISATTNIDVSAASAPSIGQALVATSSTAASWQYSSDVLTNLGDGSDGALSMSSGSLILDRDRYYTTVTLSGTATVDSNGWKIYCQGAFAISGTASVTNDGSSGGNASGGTIGTGAAITIGNTVGAGQAGGNGGAFGNNSNGSPGTSTSSFIGYGGASAVAGLGGDSGSHLATGGAAGSAGTQIYLAERVVRHDHIINMAYKIGGGGGPGGGGGASSLFATAGAGGGGGSGGGVVIIFCGSFNNTSGVGVTAKGGNGGTGGTATGGNSGSGGGGSGGGGGQIYIICITLTAIGTLNVAGGAAGATGAKAGGGFVGTAGSAGLIGKSTVYSYATNTWAVT